MALRFLLVSLVAGMGLDLPSGAELSGWVRAGRTWAESRMVEFSAYRAEAGRVVLGETGEEAVPEVARPDPATADLAFDVVVEGMASDFAAELIADRNDRTFAELGPDVFAGTIPPETEAGASIEPGPKVSRGARISSAVELTRQAMSAWVSLIVESSAEPLEGSR